MFKIILKLQQIILMFFINSIIMILIMIHTLIGSSLILVIKSI